MIRDAIVEIVGLAGSGKSTLGERLRVLAGAAPYAPSFGAALPFLLRRSCIVVPALLAQPVRGWTLRGIRHLLFHDAVIDDIARRRATGRGLVVLDQGPIYSVVAAERYVLRGPVRRPLLAHYRATLDRFADPLDAVVLLDASDEKLAMRIETRGRHHTVKGRSVGEASSFFGEYRISFEQILGQIHRTHGVPILRIDTSERSTEEVASTAVAMLGEIGVAIRDTNVGPE